MNALLYLAITVKRPAQTSTGTPMGFIVQPRSGPCASSEATKSLDAGTDFPASDLRDRLHSPPLLSTPSKYGWALLGPHEAATMSLIIQKAAYLPVLSGFLAPTTFRRITPFLLPHQRNTRNGSLGCIALV